MEAQHTPGPLFAVEIDDRSAYNIFAPNYCTAIATVSSQSNADGCMGSILTQQYALAMAAGPDLLAACQALLNALPSATTHPAIAQARAAINKATGQ